ncbi:MAG: GNAT family N-acetyltransferase, partial [Lachnospiraceae bacterium]|nr:GNAT family N-acetyltransferase [Lachnospiraceae bacterium]
IHKVENITDDELDKIRKIVGEAFVSNELFHNWGTEDERRADVIQYMALYVDYVYEAGELYSNDEMTGFIGLEDSGNAHKLPQIKMLFRMLGKLRFSKLKSLMGFANQISKSNEQYAKQRHIDALMVCVDKDHQGQGIASELITYAKEQAVAQGIPLLFDTDMKDYADMYRHFGCELYNSVTADNGVTRYSLCFRPSVS